MKEYKVYKLIDPRTLEVKYVGITIRSLSDRLRGHLRTDASVNHKTRWVAKLRTLGLKPTIELIEEVRGERKAAKREVYYIAYYRKLGKLTNIDNGGNMGNSQLGNTHWLGKNHKKKTKLKISRSRIQAFKDRPELRTSISNSNSKRLGILNPRSICVIGTSKTGQQRTFISLQEAENVLKSEGVSISRVNIGQAIKGRYKSSGGYTWKKIGIKC